MNTKRFSQTLLLRVIAAILTVPMTMALIEPGAQGQTGPSGELSVVGEVTVNGTSAISGATVFSDSTVTTAKGSSAVVSLGKLGRVEVMPSSSVNLKFDGSSVTAMLSSGRVRVSSSSGVNATVKTDDGEVLATGSQAKKFTVDIRCDDTVVSTEKGRVELRAGNSVKQIAAGNQDTAGTRKPGCRR